VIQLYVLDVPEFRPVIDEASKVADQMRSVGNYLEFGSNGGMTVERRMAGARRSVWFSAISALRGGKIAQFDSDALRLEPE
jgi:hypothetical protein